MPATIAPSLVLEYQRPFKQRQVQVLPPFLLLLLLLPWRLLLLSLRGRRVTVPFLLLLFPAPIVKHPVVFLLLGRALQGVSSHLFLFLFPYVVISPPCALRKNQKGFLFLCSTRTGVVAGKRTLLSSCVLPVCAGV